MSTRGDRDAAIDGLLRASLRAGSGGDGTDCPSPDVLAAFVEGSLSSSEREAAETHLAACERCHETLAALSEIPDAAPVGALKARPSWLDRRWLVPAAAVLAMLIVYVAVRPQDRGVPATAQNRATSVPTAAERAESNATGSTQPAPSVVAPPAKLLAQNAPLATPVSAPSRKARGDAKAVPAAPPPQAAADALEMKAAAASAAPQMAVAGAQPVTTKAIPSATPPAEARQRTDSLAESVGMTAGVGTILVTSRDGRALWRVDPRESISRSTDNGVTWRPAQGASVTGLLAASSPTATTAWAVGRTGTVVRTVDGERWTRCTFPETVDLVAVDAKDDRTATVVSRDGRRFMTSDGGASWAVVR